MSTSTKNSIRYIALSHCWGAETGLKYKTTTDNLQTRILRLETENLPPNIRYEIIVAQALRVDYMWINSICILQDSAQDLETEMKVMLEVYANAYAVVSAMSATNAHEGFLKRCDEMGPRVVVPRKGPEEIDGHKCQIAIFSTGEESHSWGNFWSDQVKNSPWNQRAW